jgi:hypothetical protein
MVNATQMTKAFNSKIKEDVNFIKEKVDALESKIISASDHYHTIAGFCNLKKSHALSTKPKNGVKLLHL